jgi:anti-sigma factor RsiW
MKHPCSSVSKLLERYLDQEVTDQERALVETHLLDCSSCRDALKSMEEFSRIMKVPLAEMAREEDVDRVWQKVKREIRSEEKHSWREVFQSWFWLSTLHQKRVWIPAVAVALVLILVTAPLLLKKNASIPLTFGVEYVESKTNNVMVYEVEKSDVTVIWLFEGSETEPTTS